MDKTLPKELQVPEQITKTLYVTICVSGFDAGDISVNDFERSNHNSDYVPLCEAEVTIAIPQDVDIRSEAVKALEGEIEKVRAEAFKKEAALQDRIRQITAIEYQPAE